MEDIKRLLKLSRIEKDIASKDIAEYMGISKSSITKIERNFAGYSPIRYLLYLRSEGVNINLLLDTINKNGLR